VANSVHRDFELGTDALFFFALLHVVFAEDLARSDGRLAPWLAGLDELKDLTKRFSPERVADATQLSSSRYR
jgi:hypothetical protein